MHPDKQVSENISQRAFCFQRQGSIYNAALHESGHAFLVAASCIRVWVNGETGEGRTEARIESLSPMESLMFSLAGPVAESTLGGSTFHLTGFDDPHGDARSILDVLSGQPGFISSAPFVSPLFRLAKVKTEILISNYAAVIRSLSHALEVEGELSGYEVRKICKPRASFPRWWQKSYEAVA